MIHSIWHCFSWSIAFCYLYSSNEKTEKPKFPQKFSGEQSWLRKTNGSNLTYLRGFAICGHKNWLRKTSLIKELSLTVVKTKGI